MGRSTNRVWSLFCGLALTVLLAGAWHSPFDGSQNTGMSAPPAPRTSIDSPPLHKVLRSHFDLSALDDIGAGLAFPGFAASVDDYTGRVFCSARCYGPLHLRPPPSLS